MDETSVGMGLLGGLMLIPVSALVWTVTAWGARGELAAGHSVGIRTRATTASNQAWRAGHEAALPWARRTGIGGMVLGVLLALSVLLPDSEESPAVGVTVLLYVLGYGGLLVGSVAMTRAANRAAHQHG